MNRFLVLLIFLVACKRQSEPPNPFATGSMYAAVKDQLDLSSMETITGKEGVIIYMARFRDNPDRYYANSSKGDVLFSRKIIDAKNATVEIQKGGEILNIDIKEGEKNIASRMMEAYHGGTGFCQRESGETFSKCFKAESDEFCDSFISCIALATQPTVSIVIAIACSCNCNCQS